MADRPSPWEVLGFHLITIPKMMENHPTWKFPIFGENPKDCVLIKGVYFHVSGFQLFRKDNPFIKMMDKPVPGIYTYAYHMHTFHLLQSKFPKRLHVVSIY